MNRAEIRRQEKKNKKRIDKAESFLKKAGFPEFKLPPAPMRSVDLTDTEVANLSGMNIAILEQWKIAQREKIKKACIMEAQEKLDKAEEYSTLCNIIASLKALEGFRYGKAAAAHLLEHYSECVETTEKQNIRKTYEELHEKWGIEFEFEDPDLNKELGFDEVNWMNEYIGRNIPYSVYCKIWDDAKNIQSVITQLAVIWELCENFSFSKHKKGDGSMLDKFMHGTKAKYDEIDVDPHGPRKALKLLKEKYDIDITWSENTQKTIDRFGL